MMKMITRDKAIEIMKYTYVYEHLRYEFPLVNAFEVKKSSINMRSWDAIIDYLSGGVVERGDEITFRCGPTNDVIEQDFHFTLELNLNPNTPDNDRVRMVVNLKNENTDWIKTKDYYWQQAEDVAVVYYVASHVIYEHAEQLIEHKKHTMRLTRKLEKDIMQSLVIAGLK